MCQGCTTVTEGVRVITFMRSVCWSYATALQLFKLTGSIDFDNLVVAGR